MKTSTQFVETNSQLADYFSTTSRYRLSLESGSENQIVSDETMAYTDTTFSGIYQPVKQIL
ncbi:hypothetical protein T12_13246 [Trichinella patagoniensis]|uniref:Uncharacterized protein n=1 Tax=Trichinella patagoniensis TaxID=990121 RepID=A0A0V0ZLL1_9BILA|nr:hypothetical protein T12_13246 [Trichinella patagoniensis]